MTMREFEVRMKAHALSQLDKERDMHWQAYLNHAVTDTEERGNKIVPVYPQFKDFFDMEKREKELLNKTGRQQQNKELSRLEKLMLQANS